ncbi:MAG: hypothetical protein ABF289_02315 [Clostridiales bacterium]
MFLKYYKHLKKNGKWRHRLPSQSSIGSLFGGGLTWNYATYKAKKHMPDIWGNKFTEEQITDDIYNKLSDGGLIPKDNLYKKDMIEYFHTKIINKINNNFSNCVDDAETLISDLIFFKENENYMQFIKCLIMYSNPKSEQIYVSIKDKTIENTDSISLKTNNYLNNYNNKINDYKRTLRKRIVTSDWYGKYLDLQVKELPFKLSNFGVKENVISENDYIDIEDIFSIDDRVLLLGSPGAGKTTALLKIALECLDNGTLLPLYIELNHYNEQPIEEFIYESTGQSLEELSKGNYLILFDGLNELPTTNSKFYQYLHNQPIQLTKQKIIITCRSNNYKGQLAEYDSYTIMPISKQEIIEFLDIEFQEKGLDIYNNLSSELREIITTPLLLIMLTGVLRYSGELPNNLGNLFQGFIEHILNYWESGKNNTYPLCDKIEALSEIAYYIYFVKNSVFCGLEESQRVLMNVFRECGYSRVEQKAAYHEVLSNGFIQQKIFIFPDSVSFYHQSFLEYFACKGLINRINKEDFSVFSFKILDHEILNYLKDMYCDDYKLSSVLFDEKTLSSQNYLQSNIASLLHIKGFSFKKDSLTNIYSNYVNNRIIADALELYALVKNRFGSYNESTDYINIALEYRLMDEKDSLHHAKTLNNYAAILDSKGDLLVSLEKHLESKKIFEKIITIKSTNIWESSEYLENMFNICELYTNIGEVDKAFDLNKKLLNFGKIKYGLDSLEYAKFSNNYGTLLMIMSDYEQSCYYIDLGLKIRESKVGKKHLIYSNSLRTKARLESFTDNFESSIKFFTNAIEIRKKCIGAKHPYTINITALYLNTLLEAGKLNYFERKLNECLKINAENPNINKFHPLQFHLYVCAAKYYKKIDCKEKFEEYNNNLKIIVENISNLIYSFDYDNVLKYIYP